MVDPINRNLFETGCPLPRRSRYCNNEPNYIIQSPGNYTVPEFET